jgi:hypothetical protein
MIDSETECLAAWEKAKLRYYSNGMCICNFPTVLCSNLVLGHCLQCDLPVFLTHDGKRGRWANYPVKNWG